MRKLLDDLNLHRPGLGFAGSNDQYCRNWSRQRRTSLGVPDRGRDILHLPRSGGPVQVVGTGFGLISGITFNSLGQLYVADRVDNVIWQFDPVPEIKAMVNVTYDSPVIDFGPLSFGLTELPAKPEVTFLLGDGTPAGGGATSYGLADVVSTNLVFGDVIGPNNLTAFAMEVDADGVTTALPYAFALPDIPTAEGIIILNFSYTVTGTDIVSGDDFSYTYANSEVTIDQRLVYHDFNNLVAGQRSCTGKLVERINQRLVTQLPPVVMINAQPPR